MRSAVLDAEDEWRFRLGAAFAELTPEPFPSLAAANLDGDLVGVPLGEVATFSVTGSPQILRRTSSAVRRMPADLLKVCVQISGRATIHQDGREVVIEPGQFALYDTGRPYDLRLEQNWTCAVMAFPRQALGLPWRLISHFMEKAHDTTTGPAAVLTGFLESAVTQSGTLPPTASGRIGDAGLNLLASVLSAEATPSVDEAAIAVRLQVLDYVRRHLRDPHLSHSGVAAAHHMSDRTLNRLFENEEFTVADYLRRLRLDGARRDLADPLLANRSVAAIAASWCFADPAHFSRLFRSSFGVSPSQARLLRTDRLLQNDSAP